MLEAVDKVAEEHERNVPLFLLLVIGGMVCSHFGVFNRKPRVGE